MNAERDADGRGPRWGTDAYLRGRWLRPAGDGWFRRVAYSDAGGGYAFRPHQTLVTTAVKKAVKELKLVFPDSDVRIKSRHFTPLLEGWWLLDHPLHDHDWLCRLLRALGIDGCEPNYVMFSDATGPSSPHPSLVSGNPVHGNPVHGNPVHGNPVHGNPVHGNPVYGNGPFLSPVHARPNWGTPVYLSPLYADRYHAPIYRETGRVATGARPAVGANREAKLPPGPIDDLPTVIVLDTGLAPRGMHPQFLSNLYTKTAPGDADIDEPDTDSDRTLDPVAGHGTFIAGVLQQLVPGVEIVTGRVLSSFGDGDVAFLHQRIEQLLDTIDDRTIVNMSFSGYLPSDSRALEHVVRTIRERKGVVVASAGNDGIGRPSFPAALPDVVGVSGLGAYGPATFSNWGGWLRASAPAVDLTSCFYVDPNRGGFPLASPQPAWPGMPDDLDVFRGWARWSGTSFAAPIVVAAIAREMIRQGSTADEAVKVVIDGPDLMRIIEYGTVVNLSPPLPPNDVDDVPA